MTDARPADGPPAGTPQEEPRAADDGPDGADRATVRPVVDLAGTRPLRVVILERPDAPSARDLRGAPGASSLEVVALPARAARPSGSPTGLSGAWGASHLLDLGSAVLHEGADLGLALEEVTGRCLVVDERGEPVDPSATAALVGLRVVAEELRPGSAPTVVHDLLVSRAVPDLLSAAGARTVRTPAGPAAVAAAVADQGAAYGADHDGHHVFGGVAHADGALLAAQHVLAALGGQSHPVSTLAELYQPYVGSGEIVCPVQDVTAARSRVVEAYVERPGGGPVDVDELDGLTVSHWAGHPQWWFSVRPSADEQVVRVRVEAADEDMMVKVRDDVLALVRSDEEI
ncbi:hypothetical protein [Cellulomonas soli]